MMFTLLYSIVVGFVIKFDLVYVYNITTTVKKDIDVAKT